MPGCLGGGGFAHLKNKDWWVGGGGCKTPFMLPTSLLSRCWSILKFKINITSAGFNARYEHAVKSLHSGS